MNHAEYLMSLSIGQYRVIRKAIHTLVRIGIPAFDAIDMVVRAHQTRHGR